MSNSFPITEKNQVKRARQRASYDKAPVYALIDTLKTGHVAFVENGEPRCIPMTVWRHEDNLYCHSANKGGFLVHWRAVNCCACRSPKLTNG